jgi:hypothetical protein
VSETYEQALADYWKQGDAMADQIGRLLDKQRDLRARGDQWCKVAKRLNSELSARQWKMTDGQVAFKKLEQDERKHDSETV